MTAGDGYRLAERARQLAEIGRALYRRYAEPPGGCKLAVVLGHCVGVYDEIAVRDVASVVTARVAVRTRDVMPARCGEVGERAHGYSVDPYEMDIHNKYVCAPPRRCADGVEAEIGAIAKVRTAVYP